MKLKGVTGGLTTQTWGMYAYCSNQLKYLMPNEDTNQTIMPKTTWENGQRDCKCNLNELSLTMPTMVLIPPPETAEKIKPVTTASTKPYPKMT